MNVQKRMSPITAFFLGLFAVVAIGITSGTLITLYGMYVIDAKASSVLGFAKGTITGLPDLLEALPPAVSDVLDDRRAPEYAAQLEIDVNLITDERSGGIRPVLTITNTGDRVVSMLAVRVATPITCRFGIGPRWSRPRWRSRMIGGARCSPTAGATSSCRVTLAVTRSPTCNASPPFRRSRNSGCGSRKKRPSRSPLR